jgi:hypothetical protein
VSASDYRVPGPDYLVAGRYRLRSKIGGGGMGAVPRGRREAGALGGGHDRGLRRPDAAARNA